MDDLALEELLQRAAPGDRAAVEQVLLDMWPLVKGYVRQHLSGDGREDVVQEALEAIRKALPGCGEKSAHEFRGLVIAITQRRRADYLRGKYARDKIHGPSLDLTEVEDRNCVDAGQRPAPEMEPDEDWERKEIEARVFCDQFMLDNLQWKGQYTPPQQTIRGAILRCRGRTQIRKDTEVEALGLSKRELEALIPEVRALLREEKEHKEVALIYYYQRLHPDITNSELRCRDGLTDLTDWEFRERKARLKRQEGRCEAELKRRFFEERPDPESDRDGLDGRCCNARQRSLDRRARRTPPPACCAAKAGRPARRPVAVGRVHWRASGPGRTSGRGTTDRHVWGLGSGLSGNAIDRRHG